MKTLLTIAIVLFSLTATAQQDTVVLKITSPRHDTSIGTISIYLDETLLYYHILDIKIFDGFRWYDVKDLKGKLHYIYISDWRIKIYCKKCKNKLYYYKLTN